MNKDYFTHFFSKTTNKQTRKQKKDRKIVEDVFTNLLDEKQHFSDTSQQASKKCENWRNHFQDTENMTKQEKNKCKTCPTTQGNRQNRVFGDKTEKVILTKVYKDSTNCEER